MARHAPQQKYHLCQAVTAIGTLSAIFWLSRMSPWAPPHHNKLVYAAALASIVVTIPFAIGLYYYRGRSQEVRATSGEEIAVQTLARAGAAVRRKPDTAKSPASRRSAK
ncbi:MAG TPA: hypothetical protein VLF59_00415 [Candidatus Saccharimonadales bacterium]|nr:hypothetical protein [Candidatus Saccharimonadales bacterium]